MIVGQEGEYSFSLGLNIRNYDPGYSSTSCRT
jgi:hypothetical protein